MSTRSDDNKTLVKTIKRYIKSGLFEKIDHIVGNKAVISILSKRNGLSLIIFMRKHQIYPASLLKYIYVEKGICRKYDAKNQMESIMISACVCGYMEIVKLLLSEEIKRLYPKIDPNVCDNGAIIYASQYGHIEVVKYLLSEEILALYPNIDPSADYNYAIRCASGGGHLEIVKFLLSDEIRKKYPKIDPCTCNNEPIILASQYGYLDVVKYLLSEKIRTLYPNIDPNINSDLMRLITENSYVSEEIRNLFISAKN